MVLYAVACLDYNYNETALKVEIIEEDNWKDALAKHSYLKPVNTDNIFKELKDEYKDIVKLSDDIETAKEEAFSNNFIFDVVEISIEISKVRKFMKE